MQIFSVQQLNHIPGYLTTGVIDAESFQVLLAKLIRLMHWH
jgi:hypothetical protein